MRVPGQAVDWPGRDFFCQHVKMPLKLSLSQCHDVTVIDIDIVSFLLSIGQKRREGVCKQNICTTITAGVIMEEALLSELSSLSWYICMYTLTRAPALLH